MSTAILPLEEIEELERDQATPGVVDQAPKQCRIFLSPQAKEPIMLTWHPGPGGVRTRIRLEPGKSVVQPLAKAEVWFGPFTVPERYAAATDPQEKEALQRFWREEKDRVLKRYDYPRQHLRDGFKPIGPHRFPDVTVTVIEPDGTEGEPIRLHQLYRIGEWDTIEYASQETAEEVREKYEEILEKQRREYESRIADMARQIARIEGLIQGAGIGAKR